MIKRTLRPASAPICRGVPAGAEGLFAAVQALVAGQAVEHRRQGAPQGVKLGDALLGLGQLALDQGGQLGVVVAAAALGHVQELLGLAQARGPRTLARFTSSMRRRASPS